MQYLIFSPDFFAELLRKTPPRLGATVSIREGAGIRKSSHSQTAQTRSPPAWESSFANVVAGERPRAEPGDFSHAVLEQPRALEDPQSVWPSLSVGEIAARRLKTNELRWSARKGRSAGRIGADGHTASKGSLRLVVRDEGAFTLLLIE
jgi:hypothetical protein